MGQRTWGPAVVALLGLLVAGCSDPEPRFADPTESASPSPSVGESPSKSSEPQALSREETVRAWVDARNAALQDGDTSSVTALYASPCSGCSELIAPIAEVYESGGFFETPGWRVVKVVSAGPTVIDARVRMAAGTSQSSAQAEPEEFAEQTREFRFEMQRLRNESWLISSIAVFEQ